jgi:glycerophosphoryl diester phosphodiesterase
VHRSPKIIAHRTFGMAAPENTVAAIRHCIESHVPVAEVDVRQTADGTFVLIHDEDLGRTTSATGRVAECHWSEIQSLDAGSWFHHSLIGERIPTLTDALALAVGAIQLYLDVRQANAGDLLDIVLSSPCAEQTLICASKETRRQLFEASSIPLRLVEFYREQPSKESISRSINEGTRVFEMPSDQITAQLANDIHELGAQVEALTLGPNDTPDQWHHAAQCGVDLLMTDNPLEADNVLYQ